MLAVADPLSWLVQEITNAAPEGSFFKFAYNVHGLIALQLACITCGMLGSMVVANRMAFFSDALAHCAFAGVAIGLLVGTVSGLLVEDSFFFNWGIPLIMVVFGLLVSVGIAYVREHTGLASDTVIGVFFAGSIGFGAMLLKAISVRGYLSPENFLFGEPTRVNVADIYLLLGLLVVAFTVMVLIYNQLVFTSFNPSLARSRRIQTQLCNYVFIVLLAMVVNLCLKTVGVLLINALLVVPPATAANLSRNLRQMFWYSIAISTLIGAIGPAVSWDFGIPGPRGTHTHFGISGTTVVASVVLFFASMFIGPWMKNRGTTTSA